jgi:hypothetical protein
MSTESKELVDTAAAAGTTDAVDSPQRRTRTYGLAQLPIAFVSQVCQIPAGRPGKHAVL